MGACLFCAGLVLLAFAGPAGFRARDWLSARRYDFAALESVRCLVSVAGAIALIVWAFDGTGRPA